MDFLSSPPTTENVPSFLGDTPSVPKKRGPRFKELTEQDYQTAANMTAEGYSRPMVAKALGFSITTLYNRVDPGNRYYDERLAEALEQGEAEDVQLMTNSVRQAGLNGNVQAATKYLAAKNPEVWSDKSKTSGPANLTVVVHTGIDRGEGPAPVTIEASEVG